MLLTVTICLHNGLRTAADIYHCGELWNVLHVCRSHKLVVIAISLFCLKFKRSFKKRRRCGRLLLIVVGKKHVPYTRANGTLLSRLDFARRSILYFRTDESRASYFRGSVRKRATGQNGISAHGFVTRDRSYETTKNEILLEGRGEENRNPGRGAWERRVARDTQRPVGIICTSLGWRWLRLIGTCANACTDRAQSICRRMQDYEFFRQTRFNRLLFSLADGTCKIC